MRRPLLALVAAAALLPAAAGAQGKVEWRHYDVYGRTAAELAAGITILSPLVVTALTALPQTDIVVTPRRVQGGYVVGRFQFDDTIVHTLPRWVDRDSAKPCLQREWDRMMAALRRHEEVHAQRYRDYVAALRAQAKALPPQPSPSALFDAVAALNTRLEAETVAWQRDYDRRTQHGRLEGVVIRAC